MEKRTSARLTIEKPVLGGYGLSYHDGYAIFVEKALPGERVIADCYLRKKDYAFARISEIEQPSPLRIEPECPVYHLCGGCSYLHASYDSELEMKQDITADTLARTGGLDRSEIPRPGIIRGDRFHYRSHGRIRLFDGRPGFYERDTNRHVPITGGCLILSENINGYMREHPFTKRDRSEELVIAEDWEGRVFSSETGKEIIEKEGDFFYRRSIGSFFQANRFLRWSMAQRVLHYGEPGSGCEILDCYCGIGFLSLPLSRYGKRIIGMELGRGMVEYARSNARENRCENAKFIAGDVRDLNLGRFSPDLIVLDPPRAGLSKKARRTILEMEPKRIVYVSCNPATFARDVRVFNSEGYVLRRYDLVDMFPGTSHIEVVSLLTKQSPRQCI